MSERGRAISTLASADLRCGANAAAAPVSGATTGTGLLAKIGAGCGPDCMNSALTRIATAANPATPAAIESRGRRNTKRNTNVKKAQMKANGIRATDRPLNSSSLSRAVAVRTDRLTPFF
jgi:hypothetical protein